MTNFYSYVKGNKLFYGWRLTNQHYVEDIAHANALE